MCIHRRPLDQECLNAWLHLIALHTEFVHLFINKKEDFVKPKLWWQVVFASGELISIVKIVLKNIIVIMFVNVS